MGKKLKSGTRGIVAKYITRNTALRKVQLSLADFRRLCIFKGIYPRDPKKKPKGVDKTYYHVKDILYLSHEPLIKQVRDDHVIDRKYRRAVTRREYSIAKAIKAKKSPWYSLYHILQERYKTFVDALYDLDDAISTLALVTTISPRVDCIPLELLSNCERVLSEFFLYVAQNRLVRKVFCSVKGFHIQIKLLNELITFLIPHDLPQEVPEQVDLKIIATFTELYYSLVSAINFKSYKLVNAKYPPSASIEKIQAGLRFLGLDYTYESESEIEHQKNQFTAPLTSCQSKQTLINDQMVSLMQSSNESLSDEDLKKLLQMNEQDLVVQNLFSQCNFYISREVPLFVIALISKSCGAAQVGWQAIGFSPYTENDSRITHHIVDRPLTDHHKTLPDREFVQPQWIFDSINSNKLLPTHFYKPGAKLPPHYSPFVLENSVSELYKTLEYTHNTKPDSALTRDASDDDDHSQIDEDDYLVQEKLQAKKKRHLERKHKEEIERRKTLLSKKHKRLLQRIEYTAEKKKKTQEKVLSKRKQA